MITKQNFRYRGPLESEKMNNSITNTTEAMNSVIAKAQVLLQNTDTIIKDIIQNTKRRGTI